MDTQTDRLLSLQEVADRLGVPLRTLYAWRQAPGKGPRGIRIGRHIRVRQSDLDVWVEQQADQRPVAS